MDWVGCGLCYPLSSILNAPPDGQGEKNESVAYRNHPNAFWNDT